MVKRFGRCESSSYRTANVFGEYGGIMSSISRLSATAIIVLLLTLGLIAAGAPGQTRIPGKRASDAARHASEAATVFDDIMSVPDKGIPRELIERAEAIAVFPGSVKAALVLGARVGQGVVSRKATNGWSAPVFYNLGGASFGPQIGAEKTDYVLLIMNDEGINGLLKTKFEIGAEASIAAGPVGRTVAASTDPTLQSAILSYSRSKGAFAGVALKGSHISPDNDLNEAYYGNKADELIRNPIVGNQVPAQVRIFPQTLAKYSAR
jgi:lipid-binding SYLF domain-containing protein